MKKAIKLSKQALSRKRPTAKVAIAAQLVAAVTTRTEKVVPRHTGWSASKLKAYKQCPANARYRYIDGLCPRCFKGRVKGGYDGKPKRCDTCKSIIPMPYAMERGDRIGRTIEKYIVGMGELDPEITNPKVLQIIKALRKAAKKKGTVKVECEVILNDKWQPVDKMTKGAWHRSKLDVLKFEGPKIAHVIDWKTGGIDKRKGEIRADAAYDDQLDGYNVDALTSFPVLEKVHASLVFIDAPGGKNPIVERPKLDLTRKGLAAAQKRWSLKVLPMLADTTHKPTPSDHACKFCDFKKSAGGPCTFG